MVERKQTAICPGGLSRRGSAKEIGLERPISFVKPHPIDEGLENDKPTRAWAQRLPGVGRPQQRWASSKIVCHIITFQC